MTRAAPAAFFRFIDEAAALRPPELLAAARACLLLEDFWPVVFRATAESLILLVDALPIRSRGPKIGLGQNNPAMIRPKASFVNETEHLADLNQISMAAKRPFRRFNIN